MATRASNKKKGLFLQRWVAEKLADALDLDYGSHDEAQIASRPSGQHGEDIILRGDAKVLVPYSIEAKSTERLELVSAIEQAKANSGDRDWVLIHKRKSFKKPIVIMGWDSWIRDLEERSRRLRNE